MDNEKDRQKQRETETQRQRDKEGIPNICSEDECTFYALSERLSCIINTNTFSQKAWEALSDHSKSSTTL